MVLGTPTVNANDASARRPSRAGARGLLAAIFFALLALGPKLGAASVAADASRVGLPGSIREVPTAANQPSPAVATGPRITRMDLRPEEVNATMPFNIALKMRNFAELEARLAQGETIAPAEMAARYWPLPEDYAAAVEWLTQQGFTIDPASGGCMVFARGTVAQVRDAFQVSFARVASGGQEFTSAISAPSVPAELAPALVGVNGLQPHIRKHSHIVHPDSTSAPYAVPYLPSDILKAYGASTLTQTGAGQTIAIVMSGYPKTSDVTQFWTVCNIGQSLGNYATVSVNGGPPTSNNADGVEEATLDVEWSSSIAPAAKIRIYGTPSLADSDLDSAYQQVYNDAANGSLNLHVVSLSFGGAETGETTTQLTTDDYMFAQLVSAGITVFASSGDDGSDPDGLTPESPASDPNVTGVGGTNITLNTTTGAVASETVWNDSSSSASGGGLSGSFYRAIPAPGAPTWAAASTKPILTTVASWQTGTGVVGAYGNRMVPDVAAPGDPNNGCMIVLNGVQTKIGGTSWGAPTWAGFATLINQARAANGSPTLGLLGPKIYPLIGSACFSDITVGNNAPNNSTTDYTAGIGYDMCTGIGRPIFPALLNELATVLLPPQSVTLAPGQNALFSPTTTNAASFQWQRMAAGTTSWVNLSDNATYSGSATGALTVNAVMTAMSGDQFQCIINGNVITPAANLIVVAPEYYIYTFAGQAAANGTANGLGTAARFNAPNQAALDSGGNIFVADFLNSAVREITPAGNVTTFAGSPAGAAGYKNANGTAALFEGVNAVVVGAGGNIYVADSANNAIRKITVAGNVTTFAGSTNGTSGNTNGAGASARFDFPEGVAMDASGNSGNIIYVADTENNLIREISSTGVVTTLAGKSGVAGYANGNGTSATFSFPSAVAVDSGGNVYVADSDNNAIRKITPTGVVTNFAGDPPYQGVADGTGNTARFNFPSGIAIDSGGNLYVADTNNNAIRKITPAGVVTTLTGQPGIAGSADGIGSAATFNQPYGLGVDGSGNLYIADTFNDTVRKALLTVAPSIQSEPVDSVALAGNTAGFSVTVSGVPAPDYQWQYLPSGGDTWSNLTDDATYNGATTANLTINVTTLAMNGDQFQVVVSNGVGNATSNVATLTTEEAPFFTTQPAGAEVTAGNSAVFTAIATGQPDTISYQWQILNPGGSTWANLTDDGVTFTGSNTTTLTVSNTTAAQSGSQFQCVASNGVSPDATSSSASLLIVPSGYFSWAAALNLAGASALPDARPFNDTIPNLVRYAMNVGATPAPGDLPGLSVQIVNNTPYLTLQYNQLIGLTGIQLVAQYSYDLVTWQTLPNGAVVQLADPNDTTQQFSASVAIPANGTVFLRLIVEPGP